MQRSTVQYASLCSTVQYSTVQYSTVQYSTVQYSTVQYSTVQYSAIQYSTVQYSTVQYSTVQYSTVQWTAVYSEQCCAILTIKVQERKRGVLLHCKITISQSCSFFISRLFSPHNVSLEFPFFLPLPYHCIPPLSKHSLLPVPVSSSSSAATTTTTTSFSLCL